MIARLEDVAAEDAALALLAEAGDGSMRDALSIMDQAIASAPLVEGRAELSAAQIRELMGSVPNAIFERLMEAVAAGQSAELMEQLNLLVNAGHSPSSLARQMVRYLRNSLMAKLGGEQTELLQISGDERARAMRTALLFTEEELTRNLQIVLRTFDDLNYRQEQRFHLELGLLKLVHAQRLLPLEELLSGVTSGTAVRGGASAVASGRAQAAPAPRPASPPAQAAPPRPAPPSTPSEPAAAPLSPFAPTGNSWGSGAKMETATNPTASAPVSSPVAVMERPTPAPAPIAAATTVSAAPAAPSPFIGSTPFAATASPALGFAAPMTEGALAIAPEPLQAPSSSAAVGSPTADALRNAVVSALASAGHTSASQILGGGSWSLDGSALRIEVAGMGKKMIALTVNPAAEKILRQELQRLGGPNRFLVLPGEGSGQPGSPVATPLAGSIEELALAHPLVQSAKEIFKAEIRSVVDLRQK